MPGVSIIFIVSVKEPQSMQTALITSHAVNDCLFSPKCPPK